MTFLEGFLTGLAYVTLGYFIALQSIYLVFIAVAWRDVTHYLRRRRYAGIDELFASPLTPGISVVVPAYNEEAVIVESVRALLGLRYPRHEVVVVNDGSSDGTLAELERAFDLVPVRKALRQEIPTAPIRGSYASRRHPNLWVIDKENAGARADALNAGVNAACHPYVCIIDADSIIEEDALLQVAKPILDDPDRVIATGGIIRIANGCTVDHGQVVDVRLPRNPLATVQVVEYFRAFLVGRVAWSRLNSLLIISGAFGLFRRSLVETVGGFWTETVGEDIELVMRLHRHMRERGEDYRIEFVPDPVCWTEAPEDIRTLSRQRRRWQRGLGESLWRHRVLVGNPRFGVLGLAAVPYFLLFEFLTPVVTLLGPPATVTWWLLGGLSTLTFVAFLVVSLLLGTLFSTTALALEEFSFRRHRRGREIVRLVVYALAETVLFRPLHDVWRAVGFVDLARGTKSWGAQQRRGFAAAPALEDPS